MCLHTTGYHTWPQSSVCHKLKAVKSYNHFRFTKSDDVFCKKTIDSEEVKQSLLEDGAVLSMKTELPPVSNSPRLPALVFIRADSRICFQTLPGHCVPQAPLWKNQESNTESNEDSDLPELTLAVPNKRPAGTVVRNHSPRGRGWGRGHGAIMTQFEWHFLPKSNCSINKYDF